MTQNKNSYISESWLAICRMGRVVALESCLKELGKDTNLSSVAAPGLAVSDKVEVTSSPGLTETWDYLWDSHFRLIPVHFLHHDLYTVLNSVSLSQRSRSEKVLIDGAKLTA